MSGYWLTYTPKKVETIIVNSIKATLSSSYASSYAKATADKQASADTGVIVTHNPAVAKAMADKQFQTAASNFDAINSERVTLQVLGDRLGISRMHASRLRDAAFRQLRDIMLTNPIILKRLGIGDSIDE